MANKKILTDVEIDGDINVVDLTASNRIYLGDGGNGYFYSDTDGRTAFTGGDLYIQTGVSNYFNYANVQFHGASTGDSHRFRGNELIGDDWEIDTSGNITGANLSGTNTGDQDLSGYALTTHSHNVWDLAANRSSINIDSAGADNFWQYKHGTQTTDGTHAGSYTYVVSFGDNRQGVQFSHSYGTGTELYYRGGTDNAGSENGANTYKDWRKLLVQDDLSGYLTTSSAASAYLPLAGGTLTGTLTISNAAVPLKFEESGYTGAGKYWRHVQDGGNLRFDSCTTGDGLFTPYTAALQLESDGAVKFGGLAIAGFMKTNATGQVSIDTNTYLTSADVTSSQWDDVTGGINYADGNVGIGIPIPTEKLHVNGNIELASGWEIGSNDGNYWQRIRTEDSSTTTANAFNFETRNGSGAFLNHLTILNNGNVGIDTASPDAKLDVSSRVQIDEYDAEGSGSTAYTSGYIRLAAPNKTGWGEGDELGKVEFYGQDASGIGARNAASIRAVCENGDGSTTTTFSGGLAFYTSGYNDTEAEALRIDRSGNVGIGTTSPTADLHIQGSSSTDVPILRVGGYGDSGSKLELAEQLTNGDMNYGYSFFNDGNASNTLIIKAHNNSTTGTTAITINRTNAITTFGTVPAVGTISAGDNSTRAASTAFVTAAITAAAPSVGNGQIDGRTSGLGLSGSMDATANQSGNTTFTVTSNAATAANASTIVYRTASAHIRARLFRANYQNQSTISGGMAFRVNNGVDDFIRFCNDKGAIRTFLGVPASGDLSNYLLNTTDTFTGTLTVSGDTDILDNDILVDTNHGFVNSGQWTRNTTPSGYIAFGPANTSHAHIYTDRPTFYFNKQLLVLNHTVWNAGNDGSGSGLDADLLDGLEASQFLRADASDTTTGSLTVDGDVITNEVRTRGGQQLILNAGEANSYATGQTNELVYVNAEAGFQVNSSPDNWGSGWAGRKTTTINDSNGNSTFANNLYIPNRIYHYNNSGTYMQFHATDQWRVVTGDSERLEVNNSATSVTSGNFLVNAGNVGIGTTSPQKPLHVSSGSTETTLIVGAEGTGNDRSARLFLNEGEGGVTNSLDYGFSLSYDGQGSQYGGISANQFGIIRHNNSSTGTPVMTMYRTNNNTTFAGTVTGTNFILSSDSRLKENVEEVDNKSINVDWKTFEMKSNKGQKRYGVIAQELEEVHPEFVRTDEEGMKSVAYVDLLIAKIAELEARLEKLEK